MFELFQRSFTGTSGNGCVPEQWSACSHPLAKINGLLELFELFGGMSFNRGVYRILRLEEVDQWTERIIAAFPSFANSIVPFGYDWLGRFFCVDLKRIDNGQPLVLLFTHISDEVFNIPKNIVDFHNGVLVEQQEAAIEVSMFSLFLNASEILSLQRNECADLVVPLYLGGSFSVKNMKATDVEISWDLAAQLLDQARHLKEGEKIKEIVVPKPE